MTEELSKAVDIYFTTRELIVSFDLEKWVDDGELEAAISACDDGSVKVEKSITDRLATILIYPKRPFGYRADE
jgi:hypothetical protein